MASAKVAATVVEEDTRDSDQKIDDIDVHVEAISTKLDGQISAISVIDRTLKDLSQLVHQLNETVSARPAAQVIATGGAPMPVGRAISQTQSVLVTPFNFEITIRPYKQAANSPNHFAFNTSPVYSALLRIVCFEPDFPGSKDAVIDIIMSSMLGFQNGVAKPDWVKLAKSGEVTTQTVVQYALNQRSALDNLFQPLASLDSSTSELVRKQQIAAVQKQLSRMMAASSIPQINKTKDNLASLFQSVSQPQGSPYLPPAARAASKSKSIFSQTFLGRAWNVRLPPETRSRVSFGSFSDVEPVEEIHFGDVPAAVPKVGGQPTAAPSAAGDDV
jgi:hypothetical protein